MLPGSYVGALILGVVAGLRTFAAPAVFWLVRYRTPAAYALGAFALLEIAADLYPKAPARTSSGGLIVRLCSGAFCGWAVTTAAGTSAMYGALIGLFGAFVGSYVGLAARLEAIAAIGWIPAAVLEDIVAVAGALAVAVYT